VFYPSSLWEVALDANQERTKMYVDRLMGKTSPGTWFGRDIAQWLSHSAFMVEELLVEGMVMGGKAVKVAKSTGNIRWLNYKLTDAEATRFEAWDSPDDDVSQGIVDLIAGGYKLSFNYDQHNQAMQCVLICADEKSPNFEKGFSTYSRNWEQLLALVVFKHLMLWNGVWPDSETPRSGRAFG